MPRTHAQPSAAPTFIWGPASVAVHNNWSDTEFDALAAARSLGPAIVANSYKAHWVLAPTPPPPPGPCLLVRSPASLFA